MSCPWSAGLLKDSLQKKGPPVEAMKFTAFTHEGTLGRIHQKFNFNKEDRRWEVREEVEPKGGAPIFDFKTYQEVYMTSAREGVSIMEAFILVYGEKNLAPSWVEKALEGPRYLAGKDCLPETVAPDSERQKKSKDILSKLQGKKKIAAD